MSVQTNDQILAEAIKATSGFKSSPSSSAQRDAIKDGIKLETSEKGKETTTDEDALKSAHPKREKQGHRASDGMAEIFKKGIAEAEGKKPDASAEEEEKKQVHVEDDADETLPGIVNSTVSAKFKRLNLDRRETRAALLAEKSAREAAEKKAADLEAKLGQGAVDLEKDPRFVDLRTKLTASEQLVSRVSFVESPEFKAKFDAPMVEQIRKMTPITELVKDPEERSAFISRLQALVTWAPGEDKDASFYDAASRLVEGQRDLASTIKSRLMRGLEDIRDLSNKRASALQNWEQSKAEVDKESGFFRSQSAQEAVNVFHRINTHAETLESERLAQYRANPELFQYDEMVKPLLEDASKEIDAAVRAGGMTPKLLAYAQAGARLPFYAKLTQTMAGVMGEQTKKIKELEKQLGGKKVSDPGSETREPAKKEASEERIDSRFKRSTGPKSDSGILSTLKGLRDSGKYE